MIRLLVLVCYAVAGLSFFAGVSAATIQLHRVSPLVIEKPTPPINHNSYAYAWRSR